MVLPNYAKRIHTRRLVAIILLLAIAASISACSRQEAAERRAEKELEERYYIEEQRRDAYNEGVQNTIHEVSGVAMDWLILSSDSSREIIKTIESWYGEEVAENIMDLIASHELEDYKAFVKEIDSLG